MSFTLFAVSEKEEKVKRQRTRILKNTPVECVVVEAYDNIGIEELIRRCERERAFVVINNEEPRYMVRFPEMGCQLFTRESLEEELSQLQLQVQ